MTCILADLMNHEAVPADTYDQVKLDFDTLADDQLLRVNADADATVNTILGALPQIQALRPQVAQLTTFDLESFDCLEHYVLALRCAQTSCAVTADCLRAWAADGLGSSGGPASLTAGASGGRRRVTGAWRTSETRHDGPGALRRKTAPIAISRRQNPARSGSRQHFSQWDASSATPWPLPPPSTASSTTPSSSSSPTSRPSATPATTTTQSALTRVPDDTYQPDDKYPCSTWP
jgi:hypothetical protein